MYPFKHLLCSLCSIVNKILIFESLLVFILFKFKFDNISGIRVVQIYICKYTYTGASQ